jgi:hypothetical protein
VVGCNFFTIQQTKHLCTEFDFVTLLMACIDGRHINNKLQAIWICDNISRDMAFGRDLLLRSGALCKVVNVILFTCFFITVLINFCRLYMLILHHHLYPPLLFYWAI